MAATPVQEAKAAQHVAYELEVMVATAIAVESPSPDAIANALAAGAVVAPLAENHGVLEACLLHARNLIDFLLGQKIATDVHRSDFVAQWAPQKTDGTRFLRKTRPLLNKHLAHITWDRVLNPPSPWPHLRIAGEIMNVFASFLEALIAAGSPHVDVLGTTH